MQQNKYDDDVFFDKYSHMDRSRNGLDSAGEWHTLKKMLPDFSDKRVLDLGCGFGWHCQYAIEHNAKCAVGIDISHKMLEQAKLKNGSEHIEYICMSIEDIDFPKGSFDVVISSLAFHYIKSFKDICNKVNHCLSEGGNFVFSAEHPVFTAYGTQEWYCDETGKHLHWPVDRYFFEGERHANFLGEDVVKYHKTLTTYVNTLIRSGFEITGLVEPEPDEHLLKEVPEMHEELRRPMMLIISSIKKTSV